MRHISWRNLAAHRLRVMLTVAAVAFGVALMAGTYVLTDTINTTYDRLVGAAFSGASAVITPRAPLGDNNSAQISPITAALVQRVAQVPGVGQASGQVISHVNLFNAKGVALGSSGATFVTGVVARPFSELQPATGRFPSGPGQVSVDQATAARYGVTLGSTLQVAGAGPLRRFEVVGTVRFSGSASFEGASVVLMTMPQAQAAAGEKGRFDEVDVAATGAMTPAQLQRRLAADLPHDVIARTEAEQVAQLSKDFAGNISFIRNFLMIFAYVALFVGAFIILNTFSVTVAQRTRELGLLRALGASKRQLRLSVVAESAVFGLVGGAAGVGLGLGLAPGLDALFKALGVDLPANGLVVEPRTVIVSLLVGVSVSVLAGLAPSIRASRVPPVAALRDGGQDGPGWLGRHSLVVSLAVLALGVAMVMGGLAGPGGGAVAGIGALVIFVGVALFSPRVVPSLARAVGAVVVWRGVTGVLARENSRRQPGRTAVTAAALMVGLALVTFVSVLAAGAKATIDHDVSSAFAGNLLVQGSSSDNQGIPGSLAADLRRVRGVALVAPCNFSEAKVDDIAGAQSVTGIEPGALFALYRVSWDEGSARSARHLTGGQALLDQTFARAHHLHVGDRLSLLSASGKRLSETVVAVADDKAQLLGSVSLLRSVVQQDFAQSNDGVDFIGYRPGAANASVKPAVDRLLAQEFPQAESATAAQFEQQQANSVNSVLGLVYVLLALAVLVSLFGLVNTLVLAVHERRRELGLLRAVGASKSQLRQMVRYESIITSLIGAVIGLVVGVMAAVSMAQYLVGSGFVLSVPVVTLVVLLVLAALAGVGAAVGPARRASKLDILTAIGAE